MGPSKKVFSLHTHTYTHIHEYSGNFIQNDQLGLDFVLFLFVEWNGYLETFFLDNGNSVNERNRKYMEKNQNIQKSDYWYANKANYYLDYFVYFNGMAMARNWLPDSDKFCCCCCCYLNRRSCWNH